MSKPNKKHLPFKTWDELVKENTTEPFTDTINGREVVVANPTGKVINQIREADEDMDSVIKALFGEENGEFVLDAWQDAPAMVLNEYVQGIMQYFGLADAEGNPRGGRS